MLALAMRREHTTGRSSNYDPSTPLVGFDHLQSNPFSGDQPPEGRVREVTSEADGDGELQEFVDIAQVQQLLQQQQQQHQQQQQQQSVAAVAAASSPCIWGAVYPPPPPNIGYTHPHHHHHHHPPPQGSFFKRLLF